MLPREDLLEVGRLRVRGPTAADARLGALDAALRSVDLRPPGLRGSEVLVIRELRDPAPRSVSVGPRTAVPASWERAAREQVADLYRHAARPARGAAPADAVAVVFGDAAELLATLAIDWLAGRTRDRWWWTVLARRRSIDAVEIGRLMIGSAAAVPPMLRALAARGEAEPFVTALGPPASAAVFAAVCRAYGVEALIAELAAPPSADRPRAIVRLREAASVVQVEAGGTTAGPARWAAAGQLPWAGHVLLSVSLAIAEAPGAARAESLGRDIAGSWVAVRHQVMPRPTQPDRSRAADAVVRVDRDVSTLSDARPAEPGAAPAAEGQGGPGGLASEMTPGSSRSRRPAGEAGESGAAPRAGARPVAARPAKAEAMRPVAPPVADVGAVRETHPQAGVPPSIEAILASSGTAFETGFGGIFFLVNVMTHLDLPGACEPGWRLASGAGAWQTLELLGRALLYRRARRVADDPVWDALRALDGRPAGARLGAGMTRPRTGQLPRRWLDAGDRPPSGVIVAGSRSAGATGALAPLAEHASPSAVEWAALVAPFLRWRIRRALGPGADARDVVGILRRRAVVVVGPTHVDVELALADVSVPSRRAGLDRDPGWQPAFGRVIRFEFR